MAAQIEKGRFNNQTSSKAKKVLKKLHKRKKRRQLNNIAKESPQYNKYGGGHSF